MRKYETPQIEIVLLETAKNLMLYGSYRVNDLQKEDNVDIGGDEDANMLHRSLWDENE